MDKTSNKFCIGATMITEEDIAVSLGQKEQMNGELENDSVSLNSSRSYTSDKSLSGLSTCSTFSLNALKKKKNL